MQALLIVLLLKMNGKLYTALRNTMIMTMYLTLESCCHLETARGVTMETQRSVVITTTSHVDMAPVKPVPKHNALHSATVINPIGPETD